MTFLNINTKYKVSTLVETLEKYKENHIKEYEEATKVYKQKVLDLLADVVDVASDLLENSKEDYNNLRETYSKLCSLKKPVNSVKNYDNHINLLKNSAEDVIELSSIDAHTILNDEWSWSQEAKTINNFYTSMKI